MPEGSRRRRLEARFVLGDVYEATENVAARFDLVCTHLGHNLLLQHPPLGATVAGMLGSGGPLYFADPP